VCVCVARVCVCVARVCVCACVCVCVCAREREKNLSNKKKATTYVTDFLLFKCRISGHLGSSCTYRMTRWRTAGSYDTVIPPPTPIICLKILQTFLLFPLHIFPHAFLHFCGDLSQSRNQQNISLCNIRSLPFHNYTSPREL
jgi:hypothetical protein